jgi:putative phosphoribosyl transferase
MPLPVRSNTVESVVMVPVGGVTIEGNLRRPEAARGVVLFAHGSGSSRSSPRNRAVAEVLNEAKLATLLLDLLTPDEELVDSRTAHLRFDIPLLAERLVGATDWLARDPVTRALRIGYFGASTGISRWRQPARRMSTRLESRSDACGTRNAAMNSRPHNGIAP